MKDRIIITNKDDGSKFNIPLVKLTTGGFYYVPRIGETIVVDGVSYIVQSVNYEFESADESTPVFGDIMGYKVPWVIVTAR